MVSTEVRSVGAIALVYALRMLGLFMVLPVFVLLGQDLEGATPMLLGMAIGGYGLSQALLQIPFGLMSDRFGRKPLIIIGLVLFALGSLLAAMSTSIYGVIAGRVLQGAGAIASVLMALVSDLTREENRTKAMATIGMAIGISFSISLVLGPILGNIFGLSGLFWATMILALFGMAVVLFWVPTPARYETHRDAQPVASQVMDVLRMPRLLRLDFGIFSLHLVLTSAFLAVPLMLEQEVGLDRSQHWWVYLSVMVVSFFAMVPFIIVGEKYRRMKGIFFGAVAVLTLASGLLFTQPGSLWAIWGMLFLFFMAFNLLEATLPSLMSKESPAGSKGTAMGVYSTSQFTGAFVGGSVGGTMLDHWGISGVLLLMLVVLAVWLVVAGTMPEPSYSTSFVVKLQAFEHADLGSIQASLAEIAGVEDVIVLPDEQEAYLKVDRQELDEAALKSSPHVVAWPTA
ncbi:MFS transporter [Marinobacteraceae bacterium S3BR75-40.1]